jgi:hypothetical protein
MSMRATDEAPRACGKSVGGRPSPVGSPAPQWDQVNSHRNRVLGGSQEWASTGAVGTATADGSASSQENRRSAFTVVVPAS